MANMNMASESVKKLTIALLMLLGLSFERLYAQENTSPDDVDFQSGTLNGRAGTALAAKHYDEAVAYADKCIEIYGNEAFSQQKALRALPKDKSLIFAQWALNDVGMAYFLKGHALEGAGKKSDALSAYTILATKLAYAQVWDPQGWFWKPADAAKERIEVLKHSGVRLKTATY